MMTGLVNHLWQSTLVALLAWLVTLALGRDRARVRYGVWLAASLKFLVPFSALVTLGARFGWRPIVLASIAPSQAIANAAAALPPAQALWFSQTPVPVPAVVHGVANVLPAVLASVWAAGALVLAVTWLVRWRRVAAIVRSSAPLEGGRVFDALRRLEAREGIDRPVALVATDSLLEPGIFGIVSPTLVWPARIDAHLSVEQVAAIVAHEVAHVRRRDNLAAALHMSVQALFWFHPVVWWIGARLVDERERACDEAVVGWGSERGAYAEGILKTCQFLVSSPVACVAGVTGSELKRRVERIMAGDARVALAAWKKGMLALAGSAALAVPFVAGVLTAGPLHAQQLAVGGTAAFDVTSVKPNDSGSGVIAMMPAANGGFRASNVTLGLLIRTAYQIQDSQIVGGPPWLFQDRFDVVGTGSAPGKDGQPFEKFKSLLTDRFHLAMHVEKRELPMYALVRARPDGKLGERATPSTVDCQAQGAAARGRGPVQLPAPGEAPRCGLSIGPGSLAIGGQPMTAVATQLSRIVGRIVVDRTGLAGAYNVVLSYAPDPGLGGRGDLPPLVNGAPPPADPNRPSIFAAIEEQLGLKLESTKGPVDVLVIDRAERPTPD